MGPLVTSPSRRGTCGRATGCGRGTCGRAGCRPRTCRATRWLRRRSALAAAGRAGVPVAAGSYLTAGLLGGSGGPARSAALRPGQRAVEVAVAGGPALAAAEPGSRVDVVVSTEPREGLAAPSSHRGRRAARAAPARRPRWAGAQAPRGRAARDAVATLRVSFRQAVYLTAAQNFAREVRLLARARGDRRRIGRAGVAAGGLSDPPGGPTSDT